MYQEQLFNPDDICRKRHGAEHFSEEANKAVEPSKHIQRGKILAHLKSVGNATCDETEIALHLSHQAASARFSELKRDGLITAVISQSGERISRTTRNGRQAGVYCVV